MLDIFQHNYLRLFYFDDFKINGSAFIDIIAPKLIHSEIISPKGIKLTCKSAELLLLSNEQFNILPSEIAEELKAKGSADARDFDIVSILFTDFEGFTQASEKLSAKALIKEINVCFKAFDNICEKFGIEKIKTIGDSYMAAGGLPVRD